MIVCVSAWLKILSICGVVVALAACQTPVATNHTSLNTPSLPHAAQVQRAQAQTIGYFDANGRFSPNQQANSAYVRQQLGWDAHGHPVLQDFYVWQHRPQTSAYAIINTEALHTWNIDDAGEGEFVFYDPQGQVSGHVRYQNGAPIGVQRHYHANGTLFKLSRYDYFGNPLQTTFYRGNGVPLYQITYDLAAGDERALVLFDPQGQPYPPAQLNAALVHAAEADIAATINSMQARTAQLAHITPPPAVAIKLPFKLAATVAGQCQQHSVQQLMGMQNLSDAQILHISGATQVRRAADNEAVEDDVRTERVTVFINPQTQRISGVFCG
ncbi:hypothetical protein LVJ82_07250 [Vitreoscilla massiliensis]|uniref:Uncharacterized protein n=1 Tax=Vitreoscilla massiliensis TaxID=1689272 RepID=A0ABY4E5X5_9NEIS|nr:hypothetical protein [Vitreoscilla massiliensis]UOO90756.1 hypothetical protein LVJ82_07250 [Vitreoscilla massiliensis]